MLKRVRFFPGQLLTADDFETEQTYQREKWRLHNRVLHGVGIVEGLGVATDDDQGAAVVVSPGVALDGLGNEIVVYDPIRVLTTACKGETCFVTLRYEETATDPVPVAAGGTEFTRILEGFSVELTAADPGSAGNAQTLGLARLVRQYGRWMVDVTYRPVRLLKESKRDGESGTT
jgi:hypothetical protein